MLSQAGRGFQRARKINPFNTRQRFFSYSLPSVQSPPRMPKNHQPLSSNLRPTRNSYILRYTKQIVTNTDHQPRYQTISFSPPRPIFAKNVFERYIGDVRKDDYSLQLDPSSDRRCLRANNMIKTLDYHTMKDDQNYQSSLGLNSSIDLEYSPSQKHTIPTQVKTIQLGDSLDLSKEFSSDIKVKKPSIIKTILNPLVKESNFKPKLLRKLGVSFQSSSGHRYGQQISKPSQNPQYTFLPSQQALVKKSMNPHQHYLKFDRFRNKITTRLDRADPYWNLRMDTSNQKIQQKDKSYDFGAYSSRKINEVKSKYAFRQCMDLKEYPEKGSSGRTSFEASDR